MVGRLKQTSHSTYTAMKESIRENIIRAAIVILFAIAAFAGARAENFKAPTKSRQSVEYTDTTTTHTYEIKEIKHPVYKSKRGAFYIWKTSKNTGKQYKYYLPKEIQKEMGREYKD